MELTRPMAYSVMSISSAGGCQMAGVEKAKVLMSGRSQAVRIPAATDLLIAAHAISAKAILVTGDVAFRQVSSVNGLVNWAEDV